MVRRRTIVAGIALLAAVLTSSGSVSIRKPPAINVPGGRPDPGGVVAPPEAAQPTDLVATLDGINISLDWPDAANASSYWVYRDFGGAAYAIAVVSESQYTDDETVPGSPHYYRVAAVNTAGVPSALSDEVEEWPIQVKQFRTPFYYAMMWGDLPDVPMTDTSIDSLAQFDGVVLMSHGFEGEASEPGYTDIMSRIRARAAVLPGGNAHDVAGLTYVYLAEASMYWAADPVLWNGTYFSWPDEVLGRGSLGPKLWDWCIANDGFLMKPDDSFNANLAFAAVPFNYGNYELADTLATWTVNAWRDTGYDGEYCGLFLDYSNTDVQSWTTDLAYVDLDGDGLTYNSSSGEKAQEDAIYRGFNLRVLQVMRQRFGEYGMANRLLVVNGNGIQNIAEQAAYVDGFMEERFNDGTTGWPGWRGTQDLTGAWESVLGSYADPARFPHAQTRPFGFMWHVYADSSLAAISAAPAMATNGWTHGNPGKHPTCSAPGDQCWTRGGNGHASLAPPVTRLPAPGVVNGYDVLEAPTVSGFMDTLLVDTQNYDMRMVLRPTGTIKGVWPYLVVAASGDTIARGGGWPRKAFTPPPPAPVAAFSGTPLTGNVPRVVTFTDASTNTPTSWAWTFGDGGTSTAQSPLHTYTTAGTYTVALAATNAGGSDAEVKTGYVAVSDPPPADAPEITEFSGTDGILEASVSHTVTGVDFGTNGSPAMTIYDELEAGSQSASWESDSGNAPFSDVPVISATAPLRRHAGSAYHGRQQFTGDRSIMDSYGTYRDGVASRTFFGGYWFRLADDWAWGGTVSGENQVGSSLANVKFVRLSTGGSTDDWTIAAHPYSGSGIWSTFVSSTCNGSGTSEAGYCCGEWAGWDDSAWHHVQFEWVDSSAAGVADARFKVWVDGQIVDEATGFIGMKCAAGGYKRIFGLGFYDSWADSAADPDKSVPYNFYIDDIYYDTQLARVELGDNATYSACTHREIQLSTSWSSTSITFDSNWGSFTGGTAYLFVIDANGVPSAGYPVTLE